MIFIILASNIPSISNSSIITKTETYDNGDKYINNFKME